MTKRYRLRADPIAGLPISSGYAEAFNKHEESFFFRFNANRAASFYTRALGLPAIITVEKDVTASPYPFWYTIRTIPADTPDEEYLYIWHCDLCHKEGAPYPDRARAEAFGERHVMGDKP